MYNTSLHASISYNIYDELCSMLRRYDKPSKSIPGQLNLLSQIGGLNYWFIHPYKKLSQIGGLFSWVIRPYKKLSQIGGLFSWDLFIWMNKPVI